MPAPFMGLSSYVLLTLYFSERSSWSSF